MSDIWDAFDKAFASMDRTFRQMDRAFKAAEKLGGSEDTIIIRRKKRKP